MKPGFFTAHLYGTKGDKLRLSSRQMPTLEDAKNWADFLNEEEARKPAGKRKLHFAFQVHLPRSIWIVNESGVDVKITHGWGDDGCQYDISGDGTRVSRIEHDGEDYYESGAFDAHYRPYSEKENQA